MLFRSTAHQGVAHLARDAIHLLGHHPGHTDHSTDGQQRRQEATNHAASARSNAAIRSAYAAGFLGKNIMGTGFDLDIVLHAGAGAYICGEETALLDSLEGRRGQPRLKPPFPAVAGLYASPSCVNNVETIANIPHIVNNGEIGRAHV